MAGVSIRIKEKRFSEPLFCDFELEIEAGSVVALLGPSGIGKSTLLRMVAGIDRDFAGTIQVGDVLAYEAPAPGFVFQDARLLPWLSAIDNVRLAGRERAFELLAKVGLGEHGDVFPRALSGGMQRRVALARALAGQSALLLLDEPFVSLDAALAEEMQALLVTHSVAEAERLADRVVRLEGRPVRIVEDRLKRKGPASF